MDSWKCLEQISINDRSLVCWYDTENQRIGVCLFHLHNKPNLISKKSLYTTWGYITHVVDNINDEKEAAEVVGLYLQDIEKENYWWEND